VLQGEVLHYNVVRNGGGDLSLEGDENRSFLSLGELVNYFRSNRGRLATRLRRALSQATLPPVAAMMARYREISCEIERADVTVSGERLPCARWSDANGCHQSYVGTYTSSVNVK